MVFNDPEILQIFHNLVSCGNNLNQIAAYDYLTTEHDEFTSKPILDENGKRIPRESIIIESINCDPTSFGREYEDLNLRYGKNKKSSEIKAHHYIISFDPRDRNDNGLTSKQAQALGMEFAQKNFPGHQTLVCTHPDGHNSAGAIHVHIVINSVRTFDVTRQNFMERPGDSLAGHKHHVTKDFLKYLKSEAMLDSQSMVDFQKNFFEKYSIEVHESRGSISYLTPDRQKQIRGRSLGTDFEKDFIHRFIVSQKNSYRKPSSKHPNLTIPAQESISRITDISTCEKRNRVLHTSHFSCGKTALICVTEKDELILHNEFVFYGKVISFL